MYVRLVFVALVVLATAAFAQPVALDGPYQVRYASNLNIGDSVVNITNSGARGADLQAGTGANITGSICVNVYAFSPDEQMIACCSCPVTPNGLRALSAQRDLISNTLTPAVPTSITIKLVATAPQGTGNQANCNNSAAAVANPGAVLVPGMVAWGTTIHAAPVTPVVYSVTETPFIPATLSAGELFRLGTLCNFILANGSGFGVCRSCQLGGLGGSKR